MYRQADKIVGLRATVIHGRTQQDKQASRSASLENWRYLKGRRKGLTWWHGKTDGRHLGKVGSLPTQQELEIFHAT